MAFTRAVPANVGQLHDFLGRLAKNRRHVKKVEVNGDQIEITLDWLAHAGKVPDTYIPLKPGQSGAARALVATMWSEVQSGVTPSFAEAQQLFDLIDTGQVAEGEAEPAEEPSDDLSLAVAQLDALQPDEEAPDLNAPPPPYEPPSVYASNTQPAAEAEAGEPDACVALGAAVVHEERRGGIERLAPGRVERNHGFAEGQQVIAHGDGPYRMSLATRNGAALHGAPRQGRGKERSL